MLLSLPEAEFKVKRGVSDTLQYAGVDYNLTLCRLQHMYHGQPYAGVDIKPYARVDFIPQSGNLDLALWQNLFLEISEF
jgi:hypothetical protein